MSEYNRLYNIYIEKSDQDLIKIVNHKNKNTIAYEAASDILKYVRGIEEEQWFPKDDNFPKKTEKNFFKNMFMKLFNSSRTDAVCSQKTNGTTINDVPESSDRSIKIQYDNTKSPGMQLKEQTGIDLGVEYAMLSTAGDDNVCPMCAQFEGKIFLITDAPNLPLCPSCSCAYNYYLKEDLPPDAVISNKKDFILPAKCTSLFYENQQKVFRETDIYEQIRLCESNLKNLSEFMMPYLSANFPAPAELACRDLLPDLYMQLGMWDKAEKTIQKCIASKAYFPEDGSHILNYFKSYKKIAIETLSYIFENPGCLQRNIYKKMGYEGEEKELLKDFLHYSKLLKEVKYNNTNQLFYDTN